MVYGDVEVYGNDRTTQETPNTQACVYKYADGTMVEFEERGRFTNHEGYKGTEVGNLFYGSEGYLEIFNDTWRAFRHREKEPFATNKDGETEDLANNHWANFIDAIRSGNAALLHGPIHDGFMSTCLPLLGNISYRVGRKLTFDGATEKFMNDPEADELLTRKYREPYVVPDHV